MANFTGTNGADVFAGTPDPDVIEGLGGDDQLSGGEQNDTISGGAGADTIDGGAGDDRLFTGRPYATFPYIALPQDNGAEHDIVTAGPGQDSIWAGYGDDVDGGDGLDSLYLSLAGSPVGISHAFVIGDFTLGGGTYKNIEAIAEIYATTFDDDITGPVGTNGFPISTAIYGLGGNDRLIGSATTNFIDGGDGNDHIVGNSETATITLLGGSGNDEIENLGVLGTVSAGAGDDIVRAGGTVYGDSGNDRIFLVGSPIGQAYRALASGGSGNDTIILVWGREATVFGGDGSDTLTLGSGNDYISTSGPAAGLEAAQTNQVDTGAEVDTVNAGGGNDRIFAGWGDIIDGGAGTDLLNVNLSGAGSGVDITIDTVATNDVTSLGTGSFTGIETLAVTGTDWADRIALTSTVLSLTLTAGGGDDVITTGARGYVINGGSGDDTLISGVGGADTFNGGTGIDTIDYRLAEAGVTVKINATGADGDRMTDVENVVGSRFDDTLTGDSRANLLDGAGGADVLAGGLGNDTYITDRSDTIIENAGEGSDTVVADFSYVLDANLENLTLAGMQAISGTGNAANNVLIGNSAGNVLLGLEGNDVLDGRGGADRMEGGSGDDVYVVDYVLDRVIELAGGGNDRIEASVSIALPDQVEVLLLTGSAGINGSGNSLDNMLTGNGAANILDGKAGADVMRGGGGDDTYVVDNANDTVLEYFAGGVDTVRSSVDWTLGSEIENVTLTGAARSATGNAWANTIIGSNGDNVLSGLDGADLLYGMSGNDILDGGTGRDLMDGGAGSDVYLLNSAAEHTGAEITDTGPSGVDEVRLNSLESGVYVFFAGDTGIERIVITKAPAGWQSSTTGVNAAAIANGVDIIGSSAGNVITGTSFADRIDGGGGDDVLRGGGGDDVYVISPDGVVNELLPKIIELADGGIDRVESAFTATLAANVENLVLTGNRAIDGTGNALDNAITGNDADNVIDGGAGADSMRGGLGNDVYVVDGLRDRVIETANAGVDEVRSSISWMLGANVENLTLTGTATIDGTGNDVANVITGNAAANLIDGRGGADTMAGGSGNDTYVVDDTGDVVVETASAGIDTVRAAITYTLTANVENLMLLGTAALNGTGNALDNTIVGNAADNVLDGGVGVDVLRGGLGNDTYVVDSATDKVIEAASAGIDTVLSSVRWTLGGNVENLVLTGSAAINGTGNALDNSMTGNVADNVLAGGDGNDRLFGAGGNDRLDGGSGNDLLDGGTGADYLTGGAGDDILVGGDGADTMLGGTGSDRFVFAALADDPSSGTLSTMDRIVDFSHAQGDRIDLSSIGDALGSPLSFIGGAAFSGIAGEVHFEAAGPSTLLSIDLDGDRMADQFFILNGTQALVADDFVL